MADKKHTILDLLARTTEIQAPLLFLVVIGMLIVPLPTWLLDLSLIANIGITMLVLLRTASVTQPLEFSVFPSLLLITTLFRLALNISSTRLILSSGDAAGAGAVIHAFGTFVVGANPVVGIIIFVILVIIQFVVITAGAGRVAEVAARFTLDAMPGKQMAIDADLNAGLIDEREARRRREAVSRESDFYGAMDGASKFVRGDAIAAIIMIIINVVGGFAVGALFHNLSITDSLSQYTMKTVGEGIVTQIPALIMSIATGLIVTRAASDSNLGNDLLTQVLGNYSTLAITAAILAVFVLVPGLPKFPFLFGALLLGALAYYRWKGGSPMDAAPEAATPEQPAAHAPGQEALELMTIDALEVEIGVGLIQLADPKQGGDLLERITSVRKQVAQELGFLVPPVRVRDNLQLKSNAYAIKLWNVVIAQGELLPRYVLAINPGEAKVQLAGAIPTTEPAFNLPACWIAEPQKLDAEMSGYTVVDPTTVLITHLSELVKRHAHEIISRQDVQHMVDKVRAAAPALVDELIPKAMSLSEVHRVLQNLLRERVPVRDLARILTTLGDYVTVTRDIDQLTEYVRQTLARSISAQYRDAEGTLEVFTLAPALEEQVLEHLRPTQFGTQVVLPPDEAEKLLRGVKSQAERAITLGGQPIMLCSSQIRPYLRRFLERYIPGIAVLSHNEIDPGIPVRSTGMVAA